MFCLLLLITAGLSQAAAVNPTGHYVQLGECQSEKVCLYNYVVDQHYFDGDAKQNITVSVDVEISCHSVGQFNRNPATQYCIVVSNTELQGTVFNESSDNDMLYQQRSVSQLLSGWFCFVQTSDGKIVAVYHSRDENNDAVDFKKSIAAAFQANFKGTEQEEEDDPQSDHIAHYRYEQNTDRVKKMHRFIDSKDVIDYSTGARKRDIQLQKDEDIEYRDGILQHSSGDTSFKIQNKKGITEPESSQEKDFSDAFSAHGSYNLDLQRCYTQTKHDGARRKRSLHDQMNQNDMTEERLTANFNITLNARRRLIAIREVIPSVTVALIRLNENLKNTRLIRELDILLELEYKYGTPRRFRPAIEDVLNYLQNIQSSKATNDIKMRHVIYSLLSGEGSLQSQLTLLEALQDAATSQERDEIIIQISTITNAHMEFVNSLEQYLLNDMEEFQEIEPLLLAFGALASNAQPEVEYEVATILLGLHDTVYTSTNDTSRLVTLLLAMGNTGSGHVVDMILSYVDSSISELQTAAIRALLKFTHLEQVINRLAEILEMDLTEEIVIQITHTIVKGYRYSADQDTDIRPESLYPMIHSLVSAVLQFNNTDLTMIVAAYINEVGGDQSSFLMAELQTRFKRASTSDWDSTDSSDYNLVASLASRQSDVNNHPNHRAYIWGKTFGINETNLKAATGVFFGHSNDCENMKGYAKAYAECNVLSRKRTLADIEILLQKTSSTLNGRLFAQIGGNTLVNINLNINGTHQCSTYNTPLTRNRYRLFSFTYSIFIYVGTVDFSVHIDLGVSASFNAQICTSFSVYNLASGTAGLVPQISLYVGGSASITLLAIVRAGVTAEVSIVYQMEPQATARVCAVSCQASSQICIRAYESWPGNSIDLYAWYQTLRVRWCGGWISYPCGLRWGSRHRWSAFDYSWSIGGSSRREVYTSCNPSYSATCPA